MGKRVGCAKVMMFEMWHGLSGVDFRGNMSRKLMMSAEQEIAQMCNGN